MPEQKMARFLNYELGGDQEGTTLRLKKWSATKLFLLMKEFGAIVEEALKGIEGDLAKLNEVTFISRLVVALSCLDTRAAKIIQESVDDPKLQKEQILEWDADDFLVVLTKIFEMNLTEDLVKNFRSLLGAVLRRKEEQKPPPEEKTKKK